MPDARTILFFALGAISAFYVYIWFTGKGRAPGFPSLIELGIGFVTNFFDTLGIGSFAPTTALFKFLKLVPDERIPGTLNVGHLPPTILEAFLFIAIVQVDMMTLVLMIGAAVVGAWFGAGIVAGWSRRQVQIGMGIALLVAATLFVMQSFGIAPGGGKALQLENWRLGVGIAGSLFLGALMTLGIGLYGPCMILVSLLGMDPKAAFPIMMGSCAFLMPVASARFIRMDSYGARASLGLAIGGLPAVLIAALIVKSLPLTAVRWLVVIVVLYAAITMLRSAAANAAGLPAKEMSRRDQWRKVLDSEVQRWSALSYDQLASELRELQVYEVEFEAKKYQVEVELLENTPQYLHVTIAVDDGTLPASIRPASDSFIRHKTG